MYDGPGGRQGGGPGWAEGDKRGQGLGLAGELPADWQGGVVPLREMVLGREALLSGMGPVLGEKPLGRGKLSEGTASSSVPLQGTDKMYDLRAAAGDVPAMAAGADCLGLFIHQPGITCLHPELHREPQPPSRGYL